MYPNVPQEPAGQPVMPSQPPSYAPSSSPARIEHPRVAVVGIMNLIFSFPYLALTVLAIIGASNPMATLGMNPGGELDFSAIINLVGFGLGGLFLLIGGINLLGHRTNGKTLTQASAGILTAVMVFNVISSLTVTRQPSFGLILSVVMVLGLLLVYPLTAALVINRPPQELGLD